ncbi:hypothetical protein Rhow_004527 [Rhodococcus wratislaviensis]|uniref:Uncharacterized protein n=1 Tax=Rhodococcus wratislaviensis TaxID=44752 RepID=A0A402CBA9_RHOWR|nr:hypothetical protein Rhow_004527 [Rhodococcus wratislaviensis]
MLKPAVKRVDAVDVGAWSWCAGRVAIRLAGGSQRVHSIVRAP